MKIEVEHHPKSEEYIKETFAMYQEIDNVPDLIIGGCVIHIYPYADTQVSEESLDGYCDAYNCELHIYDLKNKTVSKTIRHDQVDLTVASRIRIFKDLSTMIIIYRDVRLSNGQSFSVYAI